MLNQEKLNLFSYYLHERERVRIKKESGEPWPFTEDKILQNYKFTNVLRENDRTTRWMRKYWTNPHLDLPLEIQLYNCGVFRYFGTIEFASEVGYLKDGHDADRIVGVAGRMMRDGKKVFTGAYVITNGGINSPKEYVVGRRYLEDFWKYCPQLVRIARETKKWEYVADKMMTINGFGGTGFMTKEILSDAIHTPVLSDCTDRNTWSPCGPGARRGLNWLHDREEGYNQKPDKFLSEMREIFEILKDRFEDFMPKVGEDYDLHSVQFGLCEIYKYQKVLNGLGRPRSRYGKATVKREDV